jgi:tripartite-type tricarboxylate transporter receptor subunit TctC
MSDLTKKPGPSRREALAAGAGLALGGLAAPAIAQAPWPQGRTLRLVVPFPPAGATDNIARIVSNRLAEMWGVPIVVDNRAGAGGNIGNEAVARAEPDGTTILMGSPGLATNQYLYRQLGYDPIGDFAPVTLIALVPNLLVVGRHVPVATTAELIARARANPGMTFATSGIGTSVHLSGELFRKLANIDITAVHYRGSAPATQDIIGGRVDMIFDNISQILPHVRAGSVKALGITTPRRSAFAPDIPPVAETVPGFDTTSWFGFLFPARTPADIVAKLQADTKTALDSPAVRERLAVLGAEVVGSTPDEFATHIRRESETWGRVIREAGIRAE